MLRSRVYRSAEIYEEELIKIRRDIHKEELNRLKRWQKLKEADKLLTEELKQQDKEMFLEEYFPLQTENPYIPSPTFPELKMNGPQELESIFEAMKDWKPPKKETRMASFNGDNKPKKKEEEYIFDFLAEI